jgi:hypothetical protein
MERQTGVRAIEKGKYGFQKPVTKPHAEQQGYPAEFCRLTLLEQNVPKQSLTFAACFNKQADLDFFFVGECMRRNRGVRNRSTVLI